MGGSASADWERYEPPQSPDSERNREREPQQTNSNKNKKEDRTQAKSQNRSSLGEEEAKSNAFDGQKKQQLATNRNNGQRKQGTKSVADAAAINVPQYEHESKIQRNPVVDPAKVKEYVQIHFVERTSAQYKSTGPRWKMKMTVGGGKNVVDPSKVSGQYAKNKYNTTQFSDTRLERDTAGPISKPKMKVGYECMIEKPNQYQFSPHGDFVLDRETRSVNFIT